MFLTNQNKHNIWTRLCTRSRRAIKKKFKKWGHIYEYRPRGDLLKNLSEELNRPISEIYQDLIEMHHDLTK